MSALFFEDFETDKSYITDSKVITDKHIMEFAALTGDTNPIHLKKSENDKNIVHGMLSASISTGQISSLNLTKGTIIALIEQNILYLKPVFPGDTVHTVMKVINKLATKDSRHGIVEYSYELITNNNTIAIKGTNRILVKKRNKEL
ncbi:MAG: hypothetical protein JXR91_07390 [Deltaproteobacteria bacterium]|nr:hypothetical protein [Deltaproteobacteria bacterium]